MHFYDIITAENVGTTIPLSRQSSILIGHWLIVTPTGVKGAVGIIFDLNVP